MNTTSPTETTAPGKPAAKTRPWVTLQVKITHELHEEIKRDIHEVALQTRFTLSPANFTACVLENYREAEKARLLKSLDTYKRKG